MKLIPVVRLAALVLGVTLGAAAQAADPEITLVIRNNRFEPATVTVPAGQRVKLVVDNQDATAEEFESHALNREKIVPAGTRTTLFVGPLTPGPYSFYGEYHQSSAQGALIAE